MPTTTNFGWTTPADTDLVKDGAAAIRTLGNGIDTSFLDLKGGTTNQVLAKNSNTDLDFKWVADATGIPATIFDAKGDIIAATAADTADRLAVGANGTVLTADSTTATGLKWASATGGTWSLLNAGGTALTGAATITVSGISGKTDLLAIVIGGGSASASSTFRFRLNGDSGNNYIVAGIRNIASATYSPTNFTQISSIATSGFSIAVQSDDATGKFSGAIHFTDCQSGDLVRAWGSGSGQNNAGDEQEQYVINGFYDSAAVITSLSIASGTGNFDEGTLYVYGK